jgi:polyisoprenoid-binding protein YceI
MTRFQIHASSSVVNWTGKKILGLHTGTIQIQSGYLVFEGDTLINAALSINMLSIQITDMEDPVARQEFASHLKHADFFDVENFPIANWELETARLLERNNYLLQGRLTIKNHSHPVEFIAKVERLSDMLHSMGEMEVDRTLYNIRYGSGRFFENLGNTLIHDKFVLQFKLIGNKVNQPIYENLESN